MGIRYDAVYPTDGEIENVLNRCSESEDTGRRKYPGMSYEQGVRAAIEWLLFSPDDLDTFNPME